MRRFASGTVMLTDHKGKVIRSTEEGWQILEDLLCFKTQDETNKECVA